MMDENMMNMDPQHAQMHLKYKGWMLVGVGLLILINYALLDWDWWVFIGVLLVILGILKLSGHGCQWCMGQMGMTKKKRKR